MNDIDYYIQCDKASKVAYNIGDLFRELPYRKKQNKTDTTVANIELLLSQLADQLKDITNTNQ